MTHWTQQQEELRELRKERDEAQENAEFWWGESQRAYAHGHANDMRVAELQAEVEAQEARYVDLLRRYDDLRAKHQQQWTTIERYQQWAEDVTTSRVQ